MQRHACAAGSPICAWDAATKHTAQFVRPSGGTISITTANMSLDERYRDQQPEVPPGAYVMIAVTDDGHGMPPEVLNHSFEPFHMTKKVGKGVGPRAEHGVWLRQAVQRPCGDLQRAGARDDRAHLSAVDEYPRCEIATDLIGR
jgi:hypothetical protein